MKQLFLPEDYTSVLDVWQTEHAIKFIKDTFQLALAAELKLRRITAPIVVPSGKGLNDNLSGTEQPVSFGAREPRSYNRWPNGNVMLFGGIIFSRVWEFIPI